MSIIRKASFLLLVMGMILNCGCSADSDTSISDSQVSETQDTILKTVFLNEGDYDICISYGEYSDGTITHEITLTVTDLNDNEYETHISSPALGFGSYNQIPEGSEFKIVAKKTDTVPLVAVIGVPISVQGEILYYATLYSFDGEQVEIMFPPEQYGEFFPLVSDMDSISITGNTFSYSDENGETMSVELF